MANVSVLGAGSWGLGLALLLNNNGHNVTVWSVLKDEVAMLQTEREHKRCLPGVKIPDSITVSGDTENVIGSADVLVLAVASPYTRSTAKMIAPFVKEGQIIVNVAKGVEEHTLLTLCQIVEEEIPCAKVAVLSGVKNMGEFHNAGYRGLYNGETADDIFKRKKLRYREDILDNMNEDELVANLFRINQTKQKLLRDNVTKEEEADNIHYEVGKKVRKAIADIGGVMPEDMPTPKKSLKELEKEKKKLKN